MEHQAFDLDRSLTIWLRELGEQPCYKQRDLEEIEDHLRASVTALREKGLSPEEAFLLARRRFGDASSLDVEFSKVNQRHVWLGRALWMLVGVQAWILLWDFGGLARLIATWGLVQLDLFPASGSAGSNGWLRSLWPAALLAGGELALLAGGFAVLVRWARRRPQALSAGVQRVLGRTSSAILLALALLVVGLAVKSGMLVGAAVSSRVMPLSQYGAVMMSGGVAASMLTLAQLLAIPILIVVFARRARSA